MIHVLHLINGLGVGGAERLLLEISKRLDRRRFELRVATLLGAGALGREFEQAGISVIDLSNRGRFSLACGRKLGRALAKQPCDVLHAHLLHATVLGRWLRRARRVSRMVSTQHFPPREPGVTRSLHRRTAGWDDLTIAVSPSILSELEALRSHKRLRLIENGIDLARFQPDVEPMPRASFGVSAKHFIVGTTARLNSKKGIDVLVRAADVVTRVRPDVRFLIAGEGPERPALEALIDELGLVGIVQLIGNVDAPERFLATSDAFCLPSRVESYGLSAAEAMACGLPVVHSAVGGLAQLSQDGVTALQVSDHENPIALAERLLEVLDDAKLRRDLGAAAQQQARARMGIERAVEAHAELHEQLVSSGCRCRRTVNGTVAVRVTQNSDS